MRLLVILILTITTFAYGWIHLQLNVSPNDSSTKNRSVVSKEANQLTEVQKLSLEKLNFVCDRRSDSLELVKFYIATGGPNWTIKWDLSKSFDSWYGIGLNNEGCVKYIDMDGKPNGIKDSFLTNSLTGGLISLNLGQLEGLLIPNNKISGSIPELLNLPNLTTLVLEANQFSGEIPGFSNLQNLKQLWLNDNKLIGNIINFNLPALQELNLSRNLLTGTIPNFDKIPNVYWLFLSENQLTGNVPDFINMPNLYQLWLYKNQLSGTIPNFNKPKLSDLLLLGNQLSGKIPNFDKLPSLRSLRLSENQLSGTIPNFDKLPLLNSLSLYFNKLTGAVPSLNLNPELETIQINDNQLTGSLPKFNNHKFLSTLWIHNNNLSGTLPGYNIDNPKLSYLTIQENKITFSDLLSKIAIIKNLTDLANKACPTCLDDTLIYAPQKKIYSDTTILITPTTTYTLDLLIDDTVTTSTYAWYKNGILYKTIKGSNKLLFTPFMTTDAGTYTVKITNPLAPQLTLESWPIRLNAGPSLVCDRRSDSLELVRLFNATNGLNWKVKWNLNTKLPWSGVVMNSTGCVTELRLNDNSLNGNMIDLNLPALTILNLSDNQLGGSIPDFSGMGALKYLAIGGNNWSGDIPNFSHLPDLEDLSITNGTLSSTIPDFNLTPKLRYLNLANQKLTGSIPDFKLPELRALYLDKNKLTGSIPNFNLPSLGELILQENLLEGSIPNFNNLPKLFYLFCGNNLLTGSIPNFDQLPMLRALFLENNKLSGVIPNFDKIPLLGDLRLYNNQLTGNIPGFDKLPQLAFLYISFNQLTGILPDHTVANPKLNRYWIDQNKLTFSSFIQNVKKVKTLTDVLNKECPTCSNDTLIYAPQKMIYVDTSIFIPVNTTYTLDLLIDDTVTTSTYTWYKNGALYKTINGSNKLPFTTFTTNDAGTYTVKITNSLAPQLTLESWPIRLNALPMLICDRRSDSLELVKFYNATGGPNWWKKWDLSKPISTWWGITINNEGCVTEIRLNDTAINGCCSGNNLIGTLIIIKLPSLTYINLRANNLSGTIPDFHFPSLENLRLETNKLSGSIPNFKNLPKLGYLALEGNQLTGDIPNFDMMPLLYRLGCYDNQLTGPVPNLNNLPQLNRIHLNDNKLTGSIPSFDNNPKLETINLYDNELTGSIPDFKNLPLLKVLALHHNFLSGSLPGLKGCLLLENYEVHNNRMGGMIQDLSHLKNLGTLTLSDNNFSGPLPKLDKFPGLKEVWLANNNFTGSLEDYTIYNPLLRRGIFEGNKLTFSNIIKYHDKIKTLIEVTNKWSQSLFSYAPQQKIYVDTTITVPAYSNYTFDLKIDDTVTTSVYTWFKNNAFYKIVNGKNKLQFSPFKPEDAGIYSVKISNAHAPQLILESREITLVAGPQDGCNRFADSLELKRFYDSTGGSNWKIGWDLSKPISTWPGVILSTNGCVKELNLSSNNLDGKLIDLNLSELIILSLHDNHLRGSLPAFEKNLFLENFEVSQNNLNGSIPDLSHLKNLGTLTLSDNNFSGPLPKLDKFPGLKEVWLANNSFTGSLEDYTISNPLLRRGTFEGNKLTFTNIIKYHDKIKTLIEVTNKWSQSLFTYAPQDTIYRDTTIFINNNTPYTLDLMIDDTITTSTYAWYKNGSLYKTMKGNKLPFNPFTNNDAGTYTVKITNPIAPQLTLVSYQIRLMTNAASEEQDCANARIITITPCYQKIVIDSMIGPGRVLDEADNSCLDLNNTDPLNNQSESNSKWFKWTANDNLNLTFSIKPLISSEDIDFVVFELPDGINGCATKRLIRCNAASCNLSGTGLNESSTDIEETASCDRGKDGYLKSLDMVKGKTYAIMVNGFQKKNAFSIEFMLKIIALKPDNVKVKHSTPTLFDVLANDTISKGASIDVMIQEPQNGTMIYSRTSGRGTYTPNPKFSGKEILKYTVCSTICPTDCKSSTIEFEVESPCSDRNSLVLPNVIFPDSPSGDNRYFIVEALIDCPDAFGPKPTKLTVYNRWGDLVYHNVDYKNDWEGTNTQGQPLPTGTYYYLLDLGSVSAPIKGYVVIMR